MDNLTEATSASEVRDNGTEDRAGKAAYWSDVQLAEFYGVGVSTIRRWDRAGEIPASIKIGGRRLHRKANHVSTEKAA